MFTGKIDKETKEKKKKEEEQKMTEDEDFNSMAEKLKIEERLPEDPIELMKLILKKQYQNILDEENRRKKFEESTQGSGSILIPIPVSRRRVFVIKVEPNKEYDLGTSGRVVGFENGLLVIERNAEEKYEDK